MVFFAASAPTLAALAIAKSTSGRQALTGVVHANMGLWRTAQFLVAVTVGAAVGLSFIGAMWRMSASSACIPATATRRAGSKENRR